MAAIWNDLGPCEVTYNGTVIGYTEQNTEGGMHGGARWRLNVGSKPTFRDKKGDNPHDEIVTGVTMEIEANFAGLNHTQVAAIIPGANLVDLGGGKTRVAIKTAVVGTSMRDNAKALILKPLVNGSPSTDETDWVRATLAYPVPQFEVPFDMENQRVFPVLFKIFDDLTTGVLGTIGDLST